MYFGIKQRLFLLSSWTVFTFMLLVAPMPISDYEGFTYIDKLVHFILFGCFSYLLLYYMMAQRPEYRLENKLVISLMASTSFACMMEFIQTYIPSRTRSVFDLLFGILGVIFFVTVFYAVNKKR